MARASWLLLLSSFLTGIASGAELKKTYIVTMRDTQASGLLRRSFIDTSLQSVSADTASVIYTYEHTINGYAAKITDDQANALRAQPDVLSVRPDKVYHLHTSRTPAFLGLLDSGALLGRSPGVDTGIYLNARDDVNGTSAESNLVVGIFDTGVWPENPSYKDDGMPPVPSHWKGECETGPDFPATSCNKKLVGARAFYKGYVAAVTNGTGAFNWTGESQSPRDDDGHGTHTSTTSAGNEVPNASLFGQASGTARGMAKDARIAMYKVCWKEGCFDSDILSAFDQAIADGVNVMSLSLGPDQPSFNEEEGIVVGSYAAMKKGIFVAVSAGNSGPGPGTVTNLAPWVLNVAASTLDRDFPAHITLGNGKNYTGFSLYSNGSVTDIKPLADGEVLPLIHGSQAGKGNATTASLCLAGSLDPAKVAGKAVVCVRGQNGRTEKGGVVKSAEGRAMVLVNSETDGDGTIADAHILPALHLGYSDGSEVEAYAKTGNGTAVIDFEGTRLGVPAPLMASFSSRGPNVVVPGLLKPDITGPGVSILAGWSGTGPTGLDIDTRKIDWNVISGTSMSCPHLSGIATFILARRPEWSPAAIRSAIMTTAYTTTKGTQSPLLDSANDKAASVFDYGNGHVDPVAALSPGLIYDISPDDYLDFLCAVNSTSAFTNGITRSNFTCAFNQTYSVYDLNYPSFSALYDSSTNGSYTATFKRTVTNVGDAGTYEVDVSLTDPALVKVAVTPETLTFSEAGEKQSFVVSATLGSSPGADAKSQGRLVWSDGKHVVGSSMAFIWGYAMTKSHPAPIAVVWPLPLACLVEDSSTKRHLPRNYVETLEERIQLLEGMLQQQGQSPSVSGLPSSSAISEQSTDTPSGNRGDQDDAADLVSKAGILSLHASGAEPQYLGSSSMFSFSRIIHACWERNAAGLESKSPTPSELFFVNMVYAIGALLKSNPKLLSQQLYASALLHLESVCYWPSVWNLSGLALRQCIELGYHRNVKRFHLRTNLLRLELRKRAFWCAYQMDCAASVNLGLPLTLPIQEVDSELPLDIDDSAISETQIQGSPRTSPRGPPTTVSHALHQFDIRCIWARIYAVFYSNVSIDSSDKEKHQAQVQTFRRELDDWMARTPPEPRRAAVPLTVFSNMEDYKLTYYETILFLYRGQLTDKKDREEDVFLECAEAAASICQGCKRLYIGKPINYTWSTVHVLFLAGLTYMHCLWTSPAVRRSIRIDNVSTMFTTCTMLLAIMAERWEAAAPYRNLFEALSARTMAMVVDRNQVDEPDFQPSSLTSNGPNVEDMANWASQIADVNMPDAYESLLSGIVGDFSTEEEATEFYDSLWNF
ncbi:unnamed protein product [Colletotrichum noveboracense]|uniref:Xylanolytic transcriptional activator regulatory domain-containing protein n=1 Tax=Colletotrichum noveboracense TaxID=2664923 RepID=A0A9W4RX46_9PEZI|nr:unnamed protein product [Colletotrichum noveboracense]